MTEKFENWISEIAPYTALFGILFLILMLRCCTPDPASGQDRKLIQADTITQTQALQLFSLSGNKYYEITSYNVKAHRDSLHRMDYVLLTGIHVKVMGKDYVAPDQRIVVKK